METDMRYYVLWTLVAAWVLVTLGSMQTDTFHHFLALFS
jgi:hypothetical protein